MEISLEESAESASSPTPEDFQEEQQLLNMEEVKSRASNVGSTHSLYPTCVEIKRTDSVMSDGSELLNNNQHSVVADVIVEEDRHQAAAAIPLADMGSELTLSALSFSDRRDSRGSSLHCSVDNLDLLNMDTYVSPIRSSSLHSLYRLGGSCGSSHSGICHGGRHHGSGNINSSRSESRLDQVLTNTSGKSSVASNHSCFGDQADQNVTEMTFANSPFKDPEVVTADVIADGRKHHHSGSDSGFSDRSPEVSARTATPDSASASVSCDQEPKSASGSSSASPSASSSILRRRRSKRSTGSSVRIDPREDTVMILESETVRLTAASPSTSPTPPKSASSSSSPRSKARPASPSKYAYTRATPETRARERRAYVPPRAMAPINEDDDDEINKGCYYFMACLDSFWIL